MWEIYSNAFEHSNTDIGVFSCGQYYRNQNDLVLSVTDFGKGIPRNVRSFLRHKDVDEAQILKLSGADCLKWAFKPGSTTCTGDVPRGLGLDLLKEFVRLNQGKLEVYSNNAYAIVDKDGEQFVNSDLSFEVGLMAINYTMQAEVILKE